jgi:hypothetical protein
LTEKTQNIILIALLIILLALQLYWIFRQKNLKRKYTKLIINVLLWLSFIVLIFPPKTKNNRNLAKVGISDGQISDQFLEKTKDSLALETVISTTKYEKEFQDKDIQIHLLGQKFTPEFLTQLAGKNVQFHAECKKDEIQNLSWRGVLFQNETQEINGLINLEKPSTLRLTFGSQTLDSVKLEKGAQAFTLSFPSFSVGKTNVRLDLNDKHISEIKYYSRPTPKLKILVLAENPDFETKMLSEWLGKNGHTVNVETAVTKNTQSKTNINQTKTNTYNLVFATAARLTNPNCSKTLKAGGGVFVYNINEKDIALVNKYLGETFAIQRVSAETESKLPNDLIALPFVFKENKSQQKFSKWPIAISQKRVGVSLISETYPLLLSGDSVTYRHIWGSVLQFLQPIQKNNIEIKAPILQNQFTTLKFNNFEKAPEIFKTKSDTIYTKISPINGNTNIGKYVFRKPNWQTINDSLEVFVNEITTADQYFVQTKNILNSYITYQNMEPSKRHNESEILPDWLRLLISLALFIVVWIEAKW